MAEQQTLELDKGEAQRRSHRTRAIKSEVDALVERLNDLLPEADNFDQFRGPNKQIGGSIRSAKLILETLF